MNDTPARTQQTPPESHSVASSSSAGGWMRARLAWWSTPRGSVTPAIEPLVRAVRQAHPKDDIALIERAYEVAERVHSGQFRKNGDPYITHPIAVASILAELGMTSTTIAAALLHDTVEDTDYSLEEARSDFGEEIAMLVDGVTKLDKVTYGDAAKAETVRKMVIAMSKDIRVLVIKLADRLHNARTWKYVPAQKAQPKAKETLEIYAPLAHRLGMNTIKWELEDLSFATLYPKVYDEIVRMVGERAPAREEYLAKVKEQVGSDLKKAGMDATVTGRPKHYYSVYQKMIVRGRDFDEIYDLVAVRVLVDTIRDCYAAVGAVHARWTPMPGRFKDYIAMPKFNLYQSLHTTVVGPQGKPVEIQIRTHQMHQRAEYGVAAHWKYKEKSGGVPSNMAQPVENGHTDLDWLRQVLDWQKETRDPGEFLDSLRFEINSREVYVFTPRGEVIGLPTGATPVDFAYAVHTEVGHHTIGARVNGRLVPLESRLENGDVVEVLTSKVDGHGPSRDWIDFVKSPRARNKIRAWFTKERREESIERGKDEITKVMRKRHLPLQRLMTAQMLESIATGLGQKDISGLYASVGERNISAESVVDRIVRSLGGEEGASEDLAEATIPGARNTGPADAGGTDSGVTVVGVSDVWTKLARCCSPVPGDDIIGFVTRGKGISVHRRDCPNADSLLAQPERIRQVQWAPSSASVFRAQIEIEAIDRQGLLAEITSVITDQRIGIVESSARSTKNDHMAYMKFTFEMGDASHLDHIVRNLRRIYGVYDVRRALGSQARGLGQRR
ncbi:RelA/SpoT family protein [Dermatophilus congolensis]|uniref:RelA/SpoT family protein n=1 Tax=Dermatophilus congolensis TaxID=1863 RepID=UPI003C7D0F69